MQQALTSVSTLPFHLVMDTWRWKLFAGKIPMETLNAEYWMQKYTREFVEFHPQIWMLQILFN